MYTHHRQDIVRYVPPHEMRVLILFVVIHPNSTLKCSCMLECFLFLGKITFLWNYEGKSINQPQIGIFKKYIRCKACIIAFTLSIFSQLHFHQCWHTYPIAWSMLPDLHYTNLWTASIKFSLHFQCRHSRKSPAVYWLRQPRSQMLLTHKDTF